jgi:hypothetical protein
VPERRWQVIAGRTAKSARLRIGTLKTASGFSYGHLIVEAKYGLLEIRCPIFYGALIVFYRSPVNSLFAIYFSKGRLAKGHLVSSMTDQGQ